jgi:hypothetical protein
VHDRSNAEVLGNLQEVGAEIAHVEEVHDIGAPFGEHGAKTRGDQRVLVFAQVFVG